MTDKSQLIESTNQFQTLLIAFVLIVAIVYFFLELRKVEIKMSSLEELVLKLSKKLTNVDNPNRNLPVDNPYPEVPVDNPYPEVPVDNPQSIQMSNVTINEEVTHDITESNEKVTDEKSIEQNIIDSLNEPKISYDIDIDTKNEIEESKESTQFMDGLFISIENNVVEDNVVEDETVIEDNVVEDNVVEDNVETNEVEENTGPTKPLEECSIKELKDILTDMDLSTSGNKQKLIQRIESSKNKISM